MLPALLLAAASVTASYLPPDGSVLYLTHSNKVVSSVTDSRISHVALIFQREGSAWVYEATPAVVRRISLAAYRREIAELNRRREKPMRLWVMRPERPFLDAQIRRMHSYLQSQLGRRYSVKGYVRRQPTDGVHCAELAAQTITRSGRIRIEPPHAVTPGRLVELAGNLYASPRRIALPAMGPSNESWCERSWKSCYGWWDWCQWGCREALTLCW